MNETKPLHSAGNMIMGRFEVEQLLGKGGFSAVYLVQDKANDGKQYALKELIDNDRQEKNKFAFECEVLGRLDHPALPNVHEIEENNTRTYMLMDYIEGENLENLRRAQPEKRFPFAQVLSILAPIVDALEYLHTQSPPIIHRDIKPANIIVPQGGGPAMLVDFGIAKEFTDDSTTTAVRHCSPGYGAPEQYTTGTDLRTDVYGLAATIYAMLTGITPVDSLLRLTSIAGKSEDPLVPIKEFVPSLPDNVSRAIYQALAINSKFRFRTVREFWQALQPPTDTRKVALRWPFQRVFPTEVNTGPIALASRTPFQTSMSEVVLLLFLVLAVIVSALLGFGYYKINQQYRSTTPQQNSTNTVSTPTLNPIYPNLTGPYSGTVHNIAKNETTQMSLTGITQNNSNVSGYFIGLDNEGKFAGVLDTSRHFLFTVTSIKGLPLFFNGTVRPDGKIVGNYCTQDSAGQCTVDYGIWSVTKVQ